MGRMSGCGGGAGWVAQWMELMKDKDFRIGRPRQLYIGREPRDYIPIEDR